MKIMACGRHLSTLLSAVLMLACGGPKGSDLSALIGRDDREEVNVDNASYEAAVGTLVRKNKQVCTAFAVSPVTIMTAAHCYDAVDSVRSPFTFRSPQGTFGVMNPQYYRNLDLVELTLYKLKDAKKVDAVPLATDADVFRPLLKTYLELPTKKYLEKLGKNERAARWESDFELLSYDGKDGKMQRQVLLDRGQGDRGFLLHAFDTLPGSSGSPILHDKKVVGIHVGTLKPRNINLAVPIETYFAERQQKKECDAAIWTSEIEATTPRYCEILFDITVFLYDEECDPQRQSCRDPEPQTPSSGYDPDFPSDSPDPGHGDRSRGSGDRNRDRFNEWINGRVKSGQDPRSDPRWAEYAATIGGVIVELSIDATVMVLTKRYIPGTGRAVRAVGAQGMNRLLRHAGNAINRSIKRFDKGNQNTRTQDHVHFKDGTSLNKDGTIHDGHRGTPSPNRETKEWLEKYGWKVP